MSNPTAQERADKIVGTKEDWSAFGWEHSAKPLKSQIVKEIKAAVQAAREEDCKAMCYHCALGTPINPKLFKYSHGAKRPCHASPIRRLLEKEPADELPGTC